MFLWFKRSKQGKKNGKLCINESWLLTVEANSFIIIEKLVAEENKWTTRLTL